MAEPPHDIDALRAKLKSLGYLDAGVDRFVLAPARAGRSLWQIALRASVRIGVLAGLILGVSGAVAAGMRVPGLLTGLRDTITLSAMLAVAFGLSIALAAFGVIVLASRAVRWAGPRAALARNSRRITMLAGALVGIACLAYLTFWWQAIGGAGTQADWRATAAAMLGAAVVSVLLGHVTTTMAQVVVASELPEITDVPRRRLSYFTSALLAVAGAAAAATMLAVASSGGSSVERPHTLTVRPTGTRVLVIAVDGVDAGLVRALARERPPRVTSALLAPVREFPRQSTDPVREWVTIATGQPLARHGVSGLEMRRVAGLEGQLPSGASPSPFSRAVTAATDLLRLTRPTLSTGIVRREKTFWEVAAQAGLRTVAVNWWTSWPARESDGVVLTERAVLRLGRGGALHGEIAPAADYDRLRGAWPALSTRAESLAAAVAPDDTEVPPALATALRESALIDAQQLVLLDALFTSTVDLGTVYLPGLDILNTRIAELGGASGGAAMVVGAAGAIVRYYEWLDRQLTALMESRPAGVQTIFVGHPGRIGSGSTLGFIAFAPSTSRLADEEVPTATLLDIAPTALAAVGVPLALDLGGEPLPFPIAHTEPTRVPTYGRRDADVAAQQTPGTLDEEMRERLRSLGYVR